MTLRSSTAAGDASGTSGSHAALGAPAETFGKQMSNPPAGHEPASCARAELASSASANDDAPNASRRALDATTHELGERRANQPATPRTAGEPRRTVPLATNGPERSLSERLRDVELV